MAAACGAASPAARGGWGWMQLYWLTSTAAARDRPHPALTRHPLSPQAPAATSGASDASRDGAGTSRHRATAPTARCAGRSSCRRAAATTSVSGAARRAHAGARTACQAKPAAQPRRASRRLAAWPLRQASWRLQAAGGRGTARAALAASGRVGSPPPPDAPRHPRACACRRVHPAARDHQQAVPRPDGGAGSRPGSCREAGRGAAAGRAGRRT